MPFRAAWFDERNAKHALTMERVVKHLAITRLENVKREKRVREKDSTGQRHYRDAIGQLHQIQTFNVERSTSNVEWRGGTAVREMKGGRCAHNLKRNHVA